MKERIKEISIEVGNNCVDFYSHDIDFNVIEDGLRQIATEQKAIDIDKACEVYENELREIVRVVNALRKGVGDCISIEGCVKDFRKVMEG